MNIKRTERINWGKYYPVLPKLDLTLVQLESWEWFKKTGLGEALKEISPIEDFAGKNWQLEFLDYSLEQPHRTIEEAEKKSLSYERPLKVKVRLLNKQSGKSI